MIGESDISNFEVKVAYDAPQVRIVMRGMNNHLLRAVLAGLWALLCDRDRTDFIAELAHYDCGCMDDLPGLAQLIATVPTHPDPADGPIPK